jgi:LacI family transcriptional regulator
MSMSQVAQLAGVSLSTVSRVANEHPHISLATSQIVRDAMQKLKFDPITSRRGTRASRNATTKRSLGFLVFGSSGAQTGPAFHRLLGAVSEAASSLRADVVFSFVGDSEALARTVKRRQLDGLLLYGDRPSPEILAQLSDCPSVWLMTNRERPSWCDQVMSNEPVIGELAVKYLARKGHRQLACLGAGNDGWSLRMRAWAFSQSAMEVGIPAKVLKGSVPYSSDLWCSTGLQRTAEQLIDQLLAIKHLPTGLFVLEDRLVPVIEGTLAARRMRSGRGGDFEIVSCNSERTHLMNSPAASAVIDIRADVIGRRAVEQLLWRIKNPNLPERVSLLIEPELIENSNSI